MEFGLIGEKLGHSYSKIIHEKIGAYKYDLCPISKEDLDDFLVSRNFSGLNVTIPYKEAVIPYCDYITPLAEKIGSVNTLYFQNDKLCGTNTDYFGFLSAMSSAGILFQDKKVLILGDGGTAKTIYHALKDNGAAEILVVSRKNNPYFRNLISYGEISEHFDSEIIINTTPIGMFPKTEEALVNIMDFPRCTGVFDVVYNPYHTNFLLQSKLAGIPYCNGLSMLVGQATKAAEIFTENENLLYDNKKILSYLKLQVMNIVLIGMPGCGKTSIGEELSKKLELNFIDLDQEIVNESSKSIPTIFEEIGEEGFRDMEHSMVKKVSIKSPQIISTGGGVILNPENMYNLMKNGIIVFIERPLESLSTEGRPLSKSFEELKKMYKERFPKYKMYSDFSVENTNQITPKQVAEEILYLINNI